MPWVVGGRRQVPGGVLEEIGAGVLDARRLRARQRVAADEARVVDAPHERPLDRADVGHHAVRPRRRQHVSATTSGRTCTGAATKAKSASADRVLDRVRGLRIAPRATAVSRTAADGS